MADKKIILSLFDLTGNWSRPYKENGYEVIQVDIQLGIDILNWDYKQYLKKKYMEFYQLVLAQILH